jgi:hypothetical protein
MMAMKYDHEAAADQYADPSARAPRGPARRRSAATLTSHVPVRFPSSTIEAVQRLAAEDGKSVSSWIRDVVSEEVRRRLPSPSTGAWANVEADTANRAAGSTTGTVGTRELIDA